MWRAARCKCLFCLGWELEHLEPFYPKPWPTCPPPTRLLLLLLLRRLRLRLRLPLGTSPLHSRLPSIRCRTSPRPSLPPPPPPSDQPVARQGRRAAGGVPSVGAWGRNVLLRHGLLSRLGGGLRVRCMLGDCLLRAACRGGRQCPSSACGLRHNPKGVACCAGAPSWNVLLPALRRPGMHTPAMHVRSNRVPAHHFRPSQAAAPVAAGVAAPCRPAGCHASARPAGCRAARLPCQRARPPSFSAFDLCCRVALPHHQPSC